MSALETVRSTFEKALDNVVKAAGILEHEIERGMDLVAPEHRAPVLEAIEVTRTARADIAETAVVLNAAFERIAGVLSTLAEVEDFPMHFLPQDNADV